MQSEEHSTTAETLENLHYPSQHLNISEQDAHFDETMGTDVHGLKRSPEDDDDGVLNEDIKPKKKTRGRVKIEMKFIANKLRRYTTFSKRKTGIMKKAYELSTLTGTQVMLLVASETGHVYTFATRKLQPMITSESGKALIQTCLNSPDLPVTQIPNTDQRMSATGYEETDLTYTVSENDAEKDRGGIFTTQQMDTNQGINVMGGNGNSNVMTGITALSAGHSFPITTYIPSSSVQQGSKAPSSFSVQAMTGGGFTTIFTPGTTFSGTPLQLGLTQGQQQGLQVLTQPVQIQRSQHQNQAVSTCVTTSPSATTHTTSSVPMVHETHIQHQEHAMEQGNNMQSIGTVVVPITNQDGSVSLGNVVPSMLSTTQSGQIPVMYSVYASTPSGLVTVANLRDDGTTDHNSAQELTVDDTEVTHQSLSNSMTLAAVQVQQDIQHYSQAVSTQTPDEVHTIVSDGTLTVGTEGESELDKDGVPVPSNQTEV